MARRKQKIDYSIFTNFNKIWTSQRLFNFCCSNRGCGKTFYFVSYGIMAYIRDRLSGKKPNQCRQFFYIRRFKTELDTITTLFDPIKVVYREFFEKHNVQLLIEGGNFYIKMGSDKKWSKLGGYMSLSVSHQFKGSSFPRVFLIIFDEWLIEKGQRYLPGEIQKVLNLYETINRLRPDGNDCIFVALGNATSFEGPYKYQMGLRLPYHNDVWYGKDVAVFLVENKQYTDAKKKSRFGKFTASLPYQDYYNGMIENNFYLDSNSWVKPKKGSGFEYMFGFYYKGQSYGLFYNDKYAVLDKTNIKVYYQIPDDVNSGDSLKSLKKNHPIVKKLGKYFQNGLVYFQNQKIKTELFPLMAKLFLK